MAPCLGLACALAPVTDPAAIGELNVCQTGFLAAGVTLANTGASVASWTDRAARGSPRRSQAPVVGVWARHARPWTARASLPEAGNVIVLCMWPGLVRVRFADQAFIAVVLSYLNGHDQFVGHRREVRRCLSRRCPVAFTPRTRLLPGP